MRACSWLHRGRRRWRHRPQSRSPGALTPEHAFTHPDSGAPDRRGWASIGDVGTAADIADVPGARESHAEVNGVRLRYVEAGSGPLVVLLHGFPEFWYSWRHQIPALAQAGFHVVAPDMRGYGGSSKPSGWRSYRTDLLVGDVVALIRHLGHERAHVVGHDWGGAVAYLTAIEHPEVVRRLAVLNIPHPERMLAGLRTLRQLRRSWYMFMFQLPWLPEAGIRRNEFAVFRDAFASDAPGAFDRQDIERYLEAWSQPGAATGMVNYYRALLRRSPRAAARRMRPIECPVLVIWGERDRHLGAELARPAARWVPDVRLELLPEASHWVQHDSPERVCRLLAGFLAPSAEGEQRSSSAHAAPRDRVA